MKPKKLYPFMFIISGIAIIGLTISSAFQKSITYNDLIEQISNAFNKINNDLPQERVYLHIDKPFYKPGESIWFRAYLRDGQSLKASSQSEILHVDLINPKGSIEKHLELICKKGMSSGDFELGENAAGGLYKIKAYTNWQKNEAKTLLFEKEIQVQSVVLPTLKMKLDFDEKAFGAGDIVNATVSFTTLENKSIASKEIKYIVNVAGEKYLEEKSRTDAEGKAYISFTLPKNLESNDGLLNILIQHDGKNESISRSIPIVLNKLDLTLYPEGGDLVAGLQTKVAFKALNEFGKPADVEGYITNSKGTKVWEFKSFHQGMGAFDFKPIEGETYSAHITKPSKISQTFVLPDVQSRGYILNVDDIKSNEINLSVSSTEKEKLTVVATVRDQICYTGQVDVLNSKTQIKLATDKFPIGVARFTLFDSRGIERAERLAFVNKHKQLKVKLATEKDKYLPREKVKLTLKVTDENDIPMPGNFSLSVTDDKLLSFADDKSGNILSKLLLENDIKDKIEDPAFYFNNEEAKANEALDYLLMTSGWRRFTWKEILENEIPSIQYTAEKAILSGTITDIHNGNAIANAKVEVLNKNISTTTDNDGRFKLTNVDLSEIANLTISSNGYNPQTITINKYGTNNNFSLYNTAYYKKLYYAPVPSVADGAGAVNERPMRGMNKAAKLKDMRDDEDMFMEREKGEMNIEIAKENVNFAAVEKLDAEEVEVAQGAVMEFRMNDSIIGLFNANVNATTFKVMPTVARYYRARQFPEVKYTDQKSPEVRTDFRSMIYWNGNIETDRTGKATVEFYNSDEITSFRIIAEGIGADGMLGRSEKTYFTQQPFSMYAKCPVELVTGDQFSLPLTLKNNTSHSISGLLNIKFPEGIKIIKSNPSNIAMEASSAKTISIACEALKPINKGEIKIAFNSGGFNDAFVQEINISSKGFPVSIALSGKDLEKTYEVNISNQVEGSSQVAFTAYPSLMTDLLKGIESIIREPYGCFEQTSTSNYPNVLVKHYLLEKNNAEARNKKFKVPADLEANLDRGYAKLVSYETKEKGYEWFGGAPAHEALTAYGLMQFNDMKKVYDKVDDAMVNRTADWLMKRRDGNGGFKKSGQALDEFGRANEDITNAYIVYALSEAGYGADIIKEANKAYDKAIHSKDPYQLALMANTMLNMKEMNKASKAISMLEGMQKEDGSWTGLIHSITCSEGNSLSIETTSLAVMAMIKSSANEGRITNAVKYIVSSRSSYGGFGSTQGTVLALKALTSYTIHSNRTAEDGLIEIHIDGKKVSEKAYKAGESDAIVISDLSKHLTEGKHRIKIKYVGVKDALPYSLGINYSTFLPNNNKECKVELKTEMKGGVVKVGETSRLTTTIKNKTKDGLPMTMGIIGIPAGLSPQPWQLKELQEKNLVDFYEVRGNNVFLYFRQMKPEEIKTINLDLKAEIPGVFEAPASSGYLYYTNEFKSWSKPERVEIR